MSSTRKTALIFGALFLATFVFSIAAVFLYNPVLHPPKFMAGTAGGTRARLGLLCEVLLIIANIGTAVVIFPILKRQNETLALGYVAARLVECTFIAVGIVSLLAVVTLRHDAGALLLTDAKSLVAVRNWTFVLGPGFFAGVGNGLILGYLMYRSGLMPQGWAILGLIGGLLLCISGLGVVLDIIPKAALRSPSRQSRSSCGSCRSGSIRSSRGSRHLQSSRPARHLPERRTALAQGDRLDRSRESVPRGTSIGPIAGVTPLHAPGAPEVDVNRRLERRDRLAGTLSTILSRVRGKRGRPGWLPDAGPDAKAESA